MTSKKTSFPKSQIRVLLLEGVDACAVKAFEEQTFKIEYYKSSMTEEELCEKIQGVHLVGIRSKTKITEKVVQASNRLIAVGCFCIGTDQVNLAAAARKGIAVFNSPYCNSRSVAELIIGQVIALARFLGDRNKEMHQGVWAKTAVGCHEIRGMTLGIVGYGHIGTQLSVLAEMMGMEVIFFDILDRLQLGRATPVSSLDELLQKADFVTLHVPDTPDTRNMITKTQIQKMKKGSYLLNASRGKVVVLEDLAEALKSGYLRGAYVDVYPEEPVASKTDGFKTPLQGCPNTLMTPHTGGSTEEAQRAIGAEVASHLVSCVNTGKTTAAVNFPRLDQGSHPGLHRILNVHKNVPGVMRDVNSLLADFNIEGQTLATNKEIGYLVIDVNREFAADIKKQISTFPWNIKTRILF